MEHFDIKKKKGIGNTWYDLSIIKTNAANLNKNTSNRATFFPKPCDRKPWKGESEDTLSPLSDEMYQEYPGIRYKVAHDMAYKTTHG